MFYFALMAFFGGGFCGYYYSDKISAGLEKVKSLKFW